MKRTEIIGSIIASIVTLSLVQTVSQNNPSTNPIANPTQPVASLPDSTESVVCPHPTQMPITPMGSPDPECVYKQGTIGSQIRIDYNDLYRSTRKQMRRDGSSLQETEAELYRVDLEILGRAIKEGRQIQGT
jgi:hypothetical protein